MFEIKCVHAKCTVACTLHSAHTDQVMKDIDMLHRIYFQYTPKTHEPINSGFIYAIHKGKSQCKRRKDEKRRSGKPLLNITKLTRVSTNTFRKYFRSKCRWRPHARTSTHKPRDCFAISNQINERNSIENRFWIFLKLEHLEEARSLHRLN